jgi:crossover junction endodeoxyribonuclease RuvC
LETTDNLRVFAVDPGLAATGYAVLDAKPDLTVRLLEGGIIKTKAGVALENRLAQIHTSLREIILEFKPDVMSIEELYSDYKNPKTALLMAHARGVCLFAAGQEGIKVYHYPPRQVKQSLTGTGTATKSQVQRMVQARLKMSAPPKPDHVADAIAVALCHVVHQDNLEEYR